MDTIYSMLRDLSDENLEDAVTFAVGEMRKRRRHREKKLAHDSEKEIANVDPAVLHELEQMCMQGGYETPQRSKRVVHTMNDASAIVLASMPAFQAGDTEPLGLSPLLSRNQKFAAVDKGIPTPAFLRGIYPAKVTNLDVDEASRACDAGSPQIMRPEEGTVSAVTTGDVECFRSIINVIETPPRRNARHSPIAWITNEPDVSEYETLNVQVAEESATSQRSVEELMCDSGSAPGRTSLPPGQFINWLTGIYLSPYSSTSECEAPSIFTPEERRAWEVRSPARSSTREAARIGIENEICRRRTTALLLGTASTTPCKSSIESEKDEEQQLTNGTPSTRRVTRQMAAAQARKSSEGRDLAPSTTRTVRRSTRVRNPRWKF